LPHGEDALLDWDDLRIFVVAARTKSLGAAGHRLGLDAATVGRRLARLESNLKSTLFIRSRSGLQLTATGSELLQIGVNAEIAMDAALRVGKGDAISGTVRISSSEGFGTSILAPALPLLAAARPNLRVELAASAGFLSPSVREVDMVVALQKSVGARLVTEALTEFQFALYAAPELIAAQGVPATVKDLTNFNIVGFVNDLIYAPELQYLDEVHPGLSPTLSSTSIQAQKAMIAKGGGIGILPCFMADGLVRVLDSVLIERNFWLSTHKEIHETARIRAVTRWLKELVVEMRPVLMPY
jgi:DNA-binding transcriptional LysR family regulator